MCSCQKKRELDTLRQKQTAREQLPAVANNQWGPILWKFLHIAAEKSYSTVHMVDDLIVATLWNTLMKNLPNVLPCPDCQAHARQYIAAHPFDATGKRGMDLQTYVREYFFAFHNDVRVSNGQPILVHTVEATKQLYESQEYTQFNTDTLMVYFRIAIKYQVVQSIAFNAWKMAYDRLMKMLKM